MLLEVLSIVGPVLYWMGLVQGDRKLDGLNRWDGSLTSLVVPPHLLQSQQVVQIEAEDEIPFDTHLSYTSYTPQSVDVESIPNQVHLYLYFGILIATLVIISLLAERFRTQMRSSTLQSISQNLQRQIQNSLHPLVEKMIKEYHSVKSANRCYSELTDVLYDRIILLKRWIELLNTDNKLLKERPDLRNTNANTKNLSNEKGLQDFLGWTIQVKDQEIEIQRGQKETLQSNLEERNQELDHLRAKKIKAESGLRERGEELRTSRTETATLEGKKKRVEEQLEGRNQKITLLEGEKTSIEQDLRGKDRELVALGREMTGQLEGRDQKIALLEGEKTSIEQDLRGKDRELVALGKEMTTIRQKDQSLERTMLRLREELDAQKAVVTELRAELALRNRSQEDGVSTAPKPTSVAGEVAERNPVPARPPKPETKGTPMTHTLPPRPSFNNKTPVSSPASKPGSSPGADLLPSLLSGLRRPQGSVPPLLSHHQSFGARQSSSQGASSQPFPPFPPFQGFLGANTPSPVTIPGYLPSTPGPTESSSSIPNPLSRNPPPQSILTTSTIGATNGPSLFSNITRPRGPSLFGVFPPQTALFQDTNPLPGLSTPDSSQQSSATPLPKPAKEVMNPFADSFFEEKKPAPGPDLASRVIRPMRKSALSQDTNPPPGLSTLDSSQQSSATTPLPEPAKEVVKPFADGDFEENKPASGPELAARAIRPMRKRRVVVSKPWPHARQTVGEPVWHTDESVSWPHTRQINGKPVWR